MGNKRRLHCKHSEKILVEFMDYDKLGSDFVYFNINLDWSSYYWLQIKENKRNEFPLLTKKGKPAGTLKLVELQIIKPVKQPVVMI